MSQYGRVPEGSGKIQIKSLEKGFDILVEAQFNPKELQVDRTVPWSPTGEANQVNGKEASANNAGIHLQFTGAQGRTLTVELLFDQYESQAGPGFKTNVAGKVGQLERLASVKIPDSDLEDDRRPHLCMVTWGTTLRGFKCVIESISTKYTMFDMAGNPLRATCTVKLKEADSVKAKSSSAAATPTSPNGAGNGTGNQQG